MAGPLFLFAPGAGAPSSHPWIRHWVRLLRRIGKVRTLDYPYMIQKRIRPDRPSILIAAHRAALARAQKSHRGSMVLIGKSMGSRIGCHVALEDKVQAVVCMGYPLCGAGDRAKMRDEVLLKLRTPVLFVQGTRDPLCPLDLLESVRIQMQCVNRLEIVADGDHSLAVAKRTLKSSGETQADADARVLERIEAFVKSPQSQ